jgi:iron complex transport system substrate-binding protein
MRYWKIGKQLSIHKLFFFLVGFLVSCELGSTSADEKIAQAKTVNRPKKIVTLVPSLGELAADFLGTELDRIVGVSEYTDYPPGLKSKTSIGPYHRFNIEKVASLRPDLILGTQDGNSQDQVAHLKELKFPVVVVQTESFDEIKESMKQVGLALGLPTEGKRMALQLDAGLNSFRDRAKGRTPLKVMLQIGDRPLVVAGGHSFLNASVELVGARNIYSDSNAHYPRPSVEDVLHRNPDIIILLALGDDRKIAKSIARKWEQFPYLSAVKSHRIYIFDGDALLRPTLRVLEGISQLEKIIYGQK